MITIYLADLTHCTITISSDSFPLNIGLVGAYILKCNPDIKLELFKYPEDLKLAMDREPPDILGCSNYPWNYELSLSFLRYVKKRSPKTITIMGGPNISYVEADQYQLLTRNKECLDFYALYEGETAFQSILEAGCKHGFDLTDMKSAGPKGCIFLLEDKLCKYQPIPRNSCLADFPSPYLTGLLDKFFDNKLSPMIETHRGCPFTCTYCHEGHPSYNKVHRHDQRRIYDELDYIAAHIGAKVKNLMIADPNFGMFSQDLEVAAKIKELYVETDYPHTLFATSAKNRKANLINISKILAPVAMPIWLSVQSLTEAVLKNIKRQNISVAEMIAVQKELETENISSFSELIMCLPGESFETHVESLVKLIELRIGKIMCYQLMLIHGSEMKYDKDTQNVYNFTTRFRAIPRSFSDIKDVGKSLEIEEIVIATKDFPFADYLKARQLHLIISVYYNGNAFKGFLKCLFEYGADIRSFLFALLDNFINDQNLNFVLNDFLLETRNELFESEPALRKYFDRPENFLKLIEGTAGANLLQKYSCQLYMRHNQELVRIIYETCNRFRPDDIVFQQKLKDINAYYQLCFNKFIDSDRLGTLTRAVFNYDVDRWLKSMQSLDCFKYDIAREIIFSTPRENFQIVESYFERYGRDAQAFGKILTRLWIVEMYRQPVHPALSEYKTDNFN